jgi:hypothetical protein
MLRYVPKVSYQSYQFNYAWQNHRPHIVAPVSLDAEDKDSIADKTTRWAGQIMDLERSNEDFSLHVVLGEPTKQKLRSEYENAVEFLTAGVECERIHIVPQASVPEFAERVVSDIKSHLRASN